MSKHLKPRSSSLLHKKKSFSILQIAVFALAFGAMGIYAVLQSSAAPSGNTASGKPGNNAEGTISLVMSADKNANNLPNYGDAVSFTITTKTATPWVHLQCYQKAAKIAEGWKGYFETSVDNEKKSFGLNSPHWTSGEADCTADLTADTSSRALILATTSFHVDP